MGQYWENVFNGVYSCHDSDVEFERFLGKDSLLKRYTLKNPLNGSTFLRTYKTVNEAAKDAMSIFNDTGILYLIVEAK